MTSLMVYTARLVLLLVIISVLVCCFLVRILDDANALGAELMWDHKRLYYSQGIYKVPKYSSRLMEHEKMQNISNLSECNGISPSSHFAMVSMITSEGDGAVDLCWYIFAAGMLAHTFSIFVDVDMILMVFDSRGIISQDQRQALKDYGWKLCDLPFISTPRVGVSKNRYHSSQMFSKLLLWKLTEYKGVLYIDSDVLILNSPEVLFTKHFQEMHNSGYTLGMVKTGPNWSDHNAGVMLVVPSSPTYDSMIASLQNTTYYATALAEQDFLNHFWRERICELPENYNAMYFDDTSARFQCLQAFVHLTYERKEFKF